MGGHADRLVHDDEVLVLPRDAEVHLLRDERARIVGELDVDVLPALEPVAVAEPVAAGRVHRRRSLVSVAACFVVGGDMRVVMEIFGELRKAPKVTPEVTKIARPASDCRSKGSMLRIRR